MSSATGSQAYVAVIKQDPATPRAIPPTPVMQKVNFVSDDLGTAITTKTSDHIRDDRMTTDITTTGIAVGGGYEFEFQYENSLGDELLAGFLWAEEWVGNVDVDVEGGTLVQAGSVLDLTAATDKPVLVLGQKIKFSETLEEDNSKVFTIIEITGVDTYIVEPVPASEVFLLGVTADGSMIRNGKFYQPFFVERGHTDVSEYFKFLGMSCNVLALSFADQSDVTGSYQFTGLTAQVDPDVEAGATYEPVTDTPVFSTVTNMPTISIDGVIQEGCLIKEMSLEVNNNVTPKTGLGVFGACETTAHRLGITGSITMYFEDSDMYNRLLNGTPFRLDWTLVNADGHGYAFALPRVKLDADTINVSGVDDDVMDDASYVATADKTTGCMIQIDKF